MVKGILVWVLVVFQVSVFGQGINFEKLTLEEALIKAKTENKYVFVDCYTTWCGPCKRMTEFVFPSEKAGCYFNPKFVCIKLDMGKDDRRKFGEQYKIVAYPIFLILNSDGTVYHKIVGGSDIDEFIEKVEYGMEKKHSLGYLERRYEGGKMNKEELREYAFALRIANEKEQFEKVVKELIPLLSSKERVKMEYWFLLKDKEYGDEEVDFVITNIKALKRNVGDQIVDEFLYRNYNRMVQKYMIRFQNGALIDKENRKLIRIVLRELENINVKDKMQLIEQFQFIDAFLREDVQGILKVMEQMVVSGQGNQKMIPRILSVVERRDDRGLMLGIITLKDKIMSVLPEKEQKMCERMIADFNRRMME